MKSGWSLTVLLAAVLLFSAAPVLAQDFYVIAGGGPPVGTKITTLPYEIKNPGFYYLTGNLSYSGAGNGITVASDDVTLDLMGFRVEGPGDNGNNYGIYLYDGTNGHKNVEIRNGTISGWCFGLFDKGVGLRNRALNLRVENCLKGIDFEASYSGSLIKGCTVESANTGILIKGGVATINAVTNCCYGIDGYGTISNNSVSNCDVCGIYCDDASSIIGNTVIATTVNPSGPTGIQIVTNNPVLVTQNTVSVPSGCTPFSGGSGTINVNNAGF
jgi:parallel beta-helix repeat protein